MTSAALESGAAQAGAVQALRAEWVKLRTVRSTYWSLLLVGGLSLLFSALAASESETMGGSPGTPGDNDIVLDSLAGVWFGQIAAAVLAVLVITSEYSTRTIRSTFVANPRRRTVLATKAVVIVAVVAAVGLVTAAACFKVGQVILRGNGFTYENGYPAVSLTDRDAATAVLLTGAYFGFLALFSLGIGTIVRHTAGAVTIVLAAQLAPVIAISFLPEDISEPLQKFSLVGAGLAMQQTVERTGDIPLSQWGGLLVVAAYGIVAIAIALWIIGRRDA